MAEPAPDAHRACHAWDSALAVEPVDRVVACRSVVRLPSSGHDPRFCFVSVGSPVEMLLGHNPMIVDRSGADLGTSDLWNRLLDGEVAVALAPRGPVEVVEGVPTPPDAFVERRLEIRYDNVLVRFLLRQIGLAEVSSHRGAPAQLYRAVESRWSHDLSMCIDPAMLLTLGADRQRYVDEQFTERATDRLPRALGRLHDLGVRAYPRLVIV